MRWYVSYPILVAGLAFAFDTFYPDTPDFSRTPDEIRAQSRLESEKAPNVVAASEIGALPVSRLAQFSPGSNLQISDRPTASLSVLDYLAQTLTPRDAAPAPAPLELQPITVAAWKSAVVRERPAASQAARPDTLSRVALARDIQRELQRVGCYLGDIDGVWGGGSKRAILMFMDRVNAALPTREPDVFMLSLLRAQSADVCGASCPSGQSLTNAGRCVPSTLVAQSNTAAPAGAVWQPLVADAGAHHAAPFGRMSIGGPKPEDVAELSTSLARAPSDPAVADPALARTAALEPTAAAEDLPAAGDAAATTTAAASSFDTDAVLVRKAKPSGARVKSRSRPQRTSSYRHVQRLFQHPLGRM